MNAGLLPGFAKRPLGRRKTVGLLSTPLPFPTGYGLVQAAAAGALVVDSGSTTAGVLTEYLRINGSGIIHWLSFHTVNATNRDVRAVLTLDDEAVMDHTATSLAAIGVGRRLIGTGDGSITAGYHPIPFNNSLLLQASVSLSETNGFRLAYVIELQE